MIISKHILPIETHITPPNFTTEPLSFADDKDEQGGVGIIWGNDFQTEHIFRYSI